MSAPSPSVALTTGSRINPLAALLIRRLAEAGQRPCLVLSTAPPVGLARLRKARSLGWAALQRRWRHRGDGGSRDIPEPIDAYARERGYPPPWHALPGLAGVDVAQVPDLNGEAALRALRRRQVQVVVNAGGGLFRPQLIEAVAGGILNAHMGPLPAIRGMNVLEWSLLLGAPPAVTLHWVAAGIDTGDLIATTPLPVRAGDTITSLRARFVPVAVELIADHLAGVVAGTAPRQPQRRGDGRQYFAMHPRLRQIAETRLPRPAGD